MAAGIDQPERDLPEEIRSRLAENLDYVRRLRMLWQTDPLATISPATPRFSETEKNYILKCMHATGGIGQVWLAHDSDLDREVALKELRPERAANPVMVARFLREAQITSKLQHPGIVPIYEMACRSSESGQEASGELPFYTMRFLLGAERSRPLLPCQAGRPDRGPLELATLLNAFASACQTVSYAHSRGIIHRDEGAEHRAGRFRRSLSSTGDS